MSILNYVHLMPSRTSTLRDKVRCRLLCNCVFWILKTKSIFYLTTYLFIYWKMCWYLLLILGIWIFVSFFTYRYLSQKKNLFLKEVFFKKLSNVLFVIAHPDDEYVLFIVLYISCNNLIYKYTHNVLVDETVIDACFLDRPSQH